MTGFCVCGVEKLMVHHRLHKSLSHLRASKSLAYASPTPGLPTPVTVRRSRRAFDKGRAAPPSAVRFGTSETKRGFSRRLLRFVDGAGRCPSVRPALINARFL